MQNSKTSLEALIYTLDENISIIESALTQENSIIKHLEKDPLDYLEKNSFSESIEFKNLSMEKKYLLSELSMSIALLNRYSKRNDLKNFQECKKIAYHSQKLAQAIFFQLSEELLGGDENKQELPLARVNQLKEFINEIKKQNFSKKHKEEMSKIISAYELHIKNEPPTVWKIHTNDLLKESVINIYSTQLHSLVTRVSFIKDHPNLGDELLTSEISEEELVTFLKENKSYIDDIEGKRPKSQFKNLFKMTFLKPMKLNDFDDENTKSSSKEIYGLD